MLYMAIRAAVVSELGTDYLARMTRHFSYRPFLQELILFGGVTVRLLKWFADVIQSIRLQVLYIGTVEKRYAVGISVYG